MSPLTWRKVTQESLRFPEPAEPLLYCPVFCRFPEGSSTRCILFNQRRKMSWSSWGSSWHRAAPSSTDPSSSKWVTHLNEESRPSHLLCPDGQNIGFPHLCELLNDWVPSSCITQTWMNIRRCLKSQNRLLEWIRSHQGFCSCRCSSAVRWLETYYLCNKSRMSYDSHH